MFSVVISISGSVKYSDATHRPFSDPAKREEKKQRMLILFLGSKSVMHEEAQVSSVFLTVNDHVL